MKKSAKIFINVIALGLLVGFSNCDNTPPVPEPTEAEKKTILLTTGGTWNMESVKVDGVDKTSIYTPLTLSFTSSSYSTTHGGVVWPASGTWHFNDAATTITRSDNVEVTVNELTATRLVLGLNWATTSLGPGRTKAIAGAHVFTFTR
jgi:hypothetical protein